MIARWLPRSVGCDLSYFRSCWPLERLKRVAEFPPGLCPEGGDHVGTVSSRSGTDGSSRPGIPREPSCLEPERSHHGGSHAANESLPLGRAAGDQGSSPAAALGAPLVRSKRPESLCSPPRVDSRIRSLPARSSDRDALKKDLWPAVWDGTREFWEGCLSGQPSVPGATPARRTPSILRNRAQPFSNPRLRRGCWGRLRWTNSIRPPCAT